MLYVLREYYSGARVCGARRQGKLPTGSGGADKLVSEHDLGTLPWPGSDRRASLPNMTREPRQEAPPKPVAPASGGDDGLPADTMRLDALAVGETPHAALADGRRQTAVAEDGRASSHAAPPATERPSRP